MYNYVEQGYQKERGKTDRKKERKKEGKKERKKRKYLHFIVVQVQLSPFSHSSVVEFFFILFIYLFIYFIFNFFIVIQLQLSAFSPHPSTPPQLIPPPFPTSTLPLDFVLVSCR